MQWHLFLSETLFIHHTGRILPLSPLHTLYFLEMHIRHLQIVLLYHSNQLARLLLLYREGFFCLIVDPIIRI